MPEDHTSSAFGESLRFKREDNGCSIQSGQCHRMKRNPAKSARMVSAPDCGVRILAMAPSVANQHKAGTLTTPSMADIPLVHIWCNSKQLLSQSADDDLKLRTHSQRTATRAEVAVAGND